MSPASARPGSQSACSSAHSPITSSSRRASAYTERAGDAITIPEFLETVRGPQPRFARGQLAHLHHLLHALHFGRDRCAAASCSKARSAPITLSACGSPPASSLPTPCRRVPRRQPDRFRPGLHHVRRFGPAAGGRLSASSAGNSPARSKRPIAARGLLT